MHLTEPIALALGSKENLYLTEINALVLSNSNAFCTIINIEINIQNYIFYNSYLVLVMTYFQAV